MKNLVTFILLVSFFSGRMLEAQTKSEPSKPPTGGNSTEWKAWTFAATAVVTAALSIFFVSVDDGKKPHSSSH